MIHSRVLEVLTNLFLNFKAFDVGIDGRTLDIHSLKSHSIRQSA